MNDSVVDKDVPPKLQQPYFTPQLWLARRTACIELLRAHGCRSAADLGCGAGAIISLLTVPADYLDDFPSLYPPPEVLPSSPSSPSVTSPAAVHRLTKLDTLRAVPRRPLNQQQLHLTRLVGVDIDSNKLTQAIDMTRPPPDPTTSTTSLPTSSTKERWEKLTVELFEGGVEVYNAALERIEGMIASEVIEHMTPSAFAKFGSTVLGLYGPRLVVVTTPNHEFNPYFVPTPEIKNPLMRCLDPTKRTKRVFRDDDHKFEMTQSEFQEWATKQADEWDYEVSFTGVGSLANYYGTQDVNKIPFPPPDLDQHPELKNSPACLAVPNNPNQFFSTQIAIFNKIISNEAERSPRSHKPTPLPFFYSPVHSSNLPLPGTPPTPTSNVVSIAVNEDLNGQTVARTSSPIRPVMYTRATTSPTPHQLAHTHIHEPHPSASIPAPSCIILKELKKTLVKKRDPQQQESNCSMSLNEIWYQSDSIREMCGGMTASLIDAIVDDDVELEFEFELISNEVGDEALRIVWTGNKPIEQDDLLKLNGQDRSFVQDDADDDDHGHDGYDEVDEIVGGWDDENFQEQEAEGGGDVWSTSPPAPMRYQHDQPHKYASGW
ncbi:hypothetical protein OIO90_002519 [Microbotryomycetes sp. JL221]|nr:hypothetical protein OIO90_002519 [Microbotryomycetes sp. JL221]